MNSSLTKHFTNKVALLIDTAKTHSLVVGIADMEPVPFAKSHTIRIQAADQCYHVTCGDSIARLTLHQDFYDQRLAWDMIQEATP